MPTMTDSSQGDLFDIDDDAEQLRFDFEAEISQVSECG